MNDGSLYSGEGQLWYQWFETWNLKLSAHDRVRNEVKWCDQVIRVKGFTPENFESLSDIEIFEGISSFVECACVSWVFLYLIMIIMDFSEIWTKCLYMWEKKSIWQLLSSKPRFDSIFLHQFHIYSYPHFIFCRVEWIWVVFKQMLCYQDSFHLICLSNALINYLFLDTFFWTNCTCGSPIYLILFFL